MLDADVLGAKNDPDHVEPKGVTGTLKARHPHFRGPAELALFPPAHRRSGPAERPGGPGLHFDERYRSPAPFTLGPGCDQIDVPVPVPETAIRYLPTVNREPSLRDSLALQSECLLRC